MTGKLYTAQGFPKRLSDITSGYSLFESNGYEPLDRARPNGLKLAYSVTNVAWGHMSRFRAVLLAASALASAGFAEQAQATVVNNDFVVLETICGSGCNAPPLLSSSGSTTGPYTGSFTVENFSSNYQITGFEVGITPAQGDGTTDPGWTATRALVDFGSGAVPAFVFNAVPSADLGPDGALSGFYFWSQTAGSPVTIFATLNGVPTSCTTVTGTPGCDPPTGVPEPGTLSLLALGLAVLCGLLWWRRQPGAIVAVG